MRGGAKETALTVVLALGYAVLAGLALSAQSTPLVPSSKDRVASSGAEGSVTEFTLTNDLKTPITLKWLDAQAKELQSYGGDLTTDRLWLSEGQQWRIESGAHTAESHWFGIFSQSGFLCSFSPRHGATVKLSELSGCNTVHIPNAKVVYYDISGSTEKELRAQLDEKGPVGFDRYKGDATTKWFIRWTWPGYGSAACDLNAAKVSYEVEVIMPRWNPPKNAPLQLISKWAKYTHALAEHEKGHVDIVADNYELVAEAIKKATCATADAAAQAALEPIRRRDVDYDSVTRHGATQSARFP